MTESTESLSGTVLSHWRVIVAAATFGAAQIIILRAGEILWASDRGIHYTLVSLMASIWPGSSLNFDIPVAIAVGVAIAWLGLFVLDVTKRPQLPIVGLGALATVGWFVVEGRVIGSILRQPVMFIIATTGTFLITAGLSLQIYDLKRPTDLSFWETIRWAQFPAAVIALFVTVSVFTIIITIQYILSSPDPMWGTITFVSMCLLITALAVFVGYRFERRVAVVAQNPEYMGPVLGGLLARVRDDPHHGFTFRGDGELNYLEGGGIIDELTNPLGFGFLRKAVRLRQIVTIKADPVLQDNFFSACDVIGSGPVAEPGSKGVVGSVSNSLSRLWRILPITMRSGLLQWYDRLKGAPSNPTRVIERFESANVILLITSAVGPHDEDWIDAIQTVHWHYRDEVDVIVIATNAGESEVRDADTDYAAAENLDDLSDAIKKELGLPSGSELIPIDRDQEIGYERLRDRLAGLPRHRQRR